MITESTTSFKTRAYVCNSSGWNTASEFTIASANLKALKYYDHTELQI